MIKITIFTPAYNRASYLINVYKSLCIQTCKCFEWLVVDDGSNDQTKHVMEKLSEGEMGFPIRYIYKRNGGKHTAINVGVRNAIGELFFILDSDDSLPYDAIATVLDEYKHVDGDDAICGVSGLMAHHNGVLVGSSYPKNNFIASSIELRYKYRVTGDLMEVFRTAVLREFSFPEINGENFCPEALVWNRIATKYKLRCFNKVICYRDYMEGGLTSKIVEIRMNSPVATTMCYAEMCKLPIPIISRLKAAINYLRFSLCNTQSKLISQISMAWYVLYPIAYIMHKIDVRKVAIRN